MTTSNLQLEAVPFEMPDGANMRILHGLDDSSGHRIAIHTKPAVDRCDNEVELCEEFIGVVE